MGREDPRGKRIIGCHQSTNWGFRISETKSLIAGPTVQRRQIPISKLKFPLDGDWVQHMAIVRAVKEQKVVRQEVDSTAQKEVAKKKPVSSEIDFVLAAPIHNRDGSVWGVVDFDTSSPRGIELLNTEVSDAAMFRLSQYLKLIFSMEKAA